VFAQVAAAIVGIQPSQAVITRKELQKYKEKKTIYHYVLSSKLYQVNVSNQRSVISGLVILAVR